MIHWLTDRIRWARYKSKIADLPAGASAHPALDVGCGPFPIPGADFVADIKFVPFDLPEMQSKLSGRFVCCDIHRLPFEAGAFEFVHCSNVLEHTENPETAYRELQRVGKHGFAETPSVFFERIVNHSPRHRWIIGWHGERLIVQPISGLRLFGRDVYLFSPLTWWIREHVRLLWKSIMVVLDVVLNMAYYKYRW